MSLRKFYLLVARRAWAATIEAQRWTVRKIAYRLVGLVVAVLLAYALGLVQMLADKLIVLALFAGAASFVFVAEYLYHFVLQPVRIAEEGLPREGPRTSALKELYTKGRQIAKKPNHMVVGGVVFGTTFRKWTGAVSAELMKTAPNEEFGFTSLGDGAPDARMYDVRIIEQKLEKLRRIIMRLDNAEAE